MAGNADMSRELVDALRALADASAPRHQRELAARKVDAELRAWGPAVVQRTYAGTLRDRDRTEVAALIADALQHTALKAATASGAFTGEADATARAWLKSIILHFVADELRRSSVLASRAAPDDQDIELCTPAPSSSKPSWSMNPDWPVDGTTGALAVCDGPDRRLASFELRPGAARTGRDRSARGAPPEIGNTTLGVAEGEDPMAHLSRAIQFLRNIIELLRASHRPRDAATLLRSALVYATHLAGLSTEEQARVWVTDTDGTNPSKRALARVYQMRHRGRDVIRCAVLEMLQSQLSDPSAKP